MWVFLEQMKYRIYFILKLISSGELNYKLVKIIYGN